MATSDPSLFEYTLKDTTIAVIVVSNNARFTFSDRIKEHKYNPNGESTTGQGSGAYPQYHTSAIYKPEFSLMVPIDESQRLRIFLRDFAKTDGGVVNIERKRSKPRVQPVTDLLKNWLPLIGEEAFTEGDATFVEVTGKLVLEPSLDIAKSIA